MKPQEKLNREFFTLDPHGEREKLMLAAKAAGITVLTEQERAASRQKILAQLNAQEDLWVFAYGSLLWNPVIHFVEEQKAYLDGWHRTFCVRLLTGRGTVEQPGLMMALDQGKECHGKIYRISREQLEEETHILWQREVFTDTYHPQLLPVVTESGIVQALTFVANRNSNRYCKKEELSCTQVAAMIAHAEGLLGSNRDYLFQTLDALQAMNIADQELILLGEAVNNILAEKC